MLWARLILTCTLFDSEVGIKYRAFRPCLVTMEATFWLKALLAVDACQARLHTMATPRAETGRPPFHYYQPGNPPAIGNWSAADMAGGRTCSCRRCFPFNHLAKFSSMDLVPALLWGPRRRQEYERVALGDWTFWVVLDFEDSRGERQTLHPATLWGPYRTTRRQHLLLRLEEGGPLPRGASLRLRLDLRAVALGRLTARVLPLRDPLSGHPDNPTALCDPDNRCAIFAFLLPRPRSLACLPRGLVDSPEIGSDGFTPFQVLQALGGMEDQHTAVRPAEELLSSPELSLIHI